MLGRDRKRQDVEEKVLDVDASMQGTISFKDPVHLRINGKFEGALDTKGVLTIGENATVNANINGEKIVIAGRVNGDIAASKEVEILSSARMFGNIRTPVLSVEKGAVLHGNTFMVSEEKKTGRSGLMTVEEVAGYLEVDVRTVDEWANLGRIPATKEDGGWRFEKAKIEEWVAKEKIA
jgi:excisionase family DNA binding protein